MTARVATACALACLSLGCGATPSSPATDNGGEPVILAANQQTTQSIALDETHVYWTNAGRRSNGFADGAVLRIAKQGGSSEVLASNQEAPSALTVDDTHVYWISQDQVMRVAKGGGTPEPLWPSGVFGLGRVALDGAFVYWSSSDKVRRIPKAGGEAPVEIATGQEGVSALLLDGSDLYWTLQGSDTGEPADGAIMRAPKDGSGVAGALVTHQPRPSALALVGNRLYWVNYIGGQVMSAEKDSGANVTQLASSKSGSPSLAVVDDLAFWSDYFAIHRVATSGGSAQTLSEDYTVVQVAADATHVYWAVQGGLDAPEGAVKRLAH